MIQLSFYSGRFDEYLYQPEEIQALARWEDRLGNAFGGFTKFKAIGYWQGAVEDSVVYIIVFDEQGYPTWEFMAKQAKLSLAEALSQDEVLVTWIQIGGLI